MYENTVGKNYDIAMPAKDIAKNIRQHIKTAHPGWKFSVRTTCSTYTPCLTITLKHAPERVFKTQDELKNIVPEWKHDKLRRMPFDDYTYHNTTSIDDYEQLIMTDEAYRVMKEIYDYAESFNMNDSDAMTDYFSCKFFSYYEVFIEKPSEEVAL